MIKTLSFWFKVLVCLCIFLCTVTSTQAVEQRQSIEKIKPAGETLAGDKAVAMAAANPATVLQNPALGEVLPDRRHYKVEALSFKCVNKGSDFNQISLLIIDEDPSRNTRTLTGTIDNLGTGQSWDFKPGKNCILPIDESSEPYPSEGVAPFSSSKLFWDKENVWTCKGGVPGPFKFTVKMYEIDYPRSESHDYSPDAWPFTDEGDRLIAERTVAFSPEELAEAMPNLYDTYDETIKIGPCNQGHCYTLTYRLTRVPDRVLAQSK